MVAIGGQAYSLYCSLWPQTVEVNGAKMANDGLQMLRLLTGKDEVALRRPSGKVIDQSIYDVVVRQYLPPGHSLPALPERSADVLDYIAARYVRRENITPETVSRMDNAVSADMPTCEQLLLLDALIMQALPQADPESLDRLDRWSARAYELGSGIATVRGSRGAVLIEIGRPEEGLALLADGLNGQEFNDCLVHAFRALGHFELGDTARAESEFAAAKALFKHEQWQAQDIRQMVERIGKTIGRELDLPATWSVEAARAAFKNQTSNPPARQDRP